MKTSKVKVKGSSEYANDFVNLATSLGNVKFSGIVLSKQEIKGLNGKKKAGVYVYDFYGNSEDVKKIADTIYYMLLDGEGEGIKLKIKKKLPKPGKGEGKVDDKFCQLEADLKYWGQTKEVFFWDLPDCKKVKVAHEYVISEIVAPQGEKDFEKIRVLAKRKGKIIRKIVVDKGGEKKEEAGLEA